MTKQEAIAVLENLKAQMDYSEYDALNIAIEALKVSAGIKALEQKLEEKCKWIHYDYRTMCPKEHNVDNPYWRIPENRMDALKYCPYCGKEIEVEE